jgi:hypothetical protein
MLLKCWCRCKVLTTELLRIDSALEGMWGLLQNGHLKHEDLVSSLELVVTGLTKTGRVRDAAELLEEATRVGRSIFTLDKTNAILSSLSMSCSAEDDYARAFVEVASACLPLLYSKSTGTFISTDWTARRNE